MGFAKIEEHVLLFMAYFMGIFSRGSIFFSMELENLGGHIIANSTPSKGGVFVEFTRKGPSLNSVASYRIYI